MEPTRKSSPARRILAAACVILLGATLHGTADAAQQASFPTADEAVGALVAAAEADDQARLLSILGPGSEKLVSSGDAIADRETRHTFLDAYHEQHKLLPEGDARMRLVVGADEWPLPIPLEKAGETWHFDATAGAQEIIARRIGRDEIAAIGVLAAVVDAQHAYFDMMQHYAPNLVSTPGSRDGLYWPAEPGEEESPLAPLVSRAGNEGYPNDWASGHPTPYQGYFFKILKRQGDESPEGAMNYLVDGRMTRGFAVLAWPASYGSSGIMSFEVNQAGTIFQKDLGSDTSAIAAHTTQFDSDLSWARVDIASQD